MGSSTSHNPIGFHGLLRELASLVTIPQNDRDTKLGWRKICVARFERIISRCHFSLTLNTASLLTNVIYWLFCTKIGMNLIILTRIHTRRCCLKNKSWDMSAWCVVAPSAFISLPRVEAATIWHFLPESYVVVRFEITIDIGGNCVSWCDAV
jgi:hypothetical protein